MVIAARRAQFVSEACVRYSPPLTGYLHWQPYSETWIVRYGKARITADRETIEAGPGDIIVVSAETRHKFKNAGTERLDIICIHASPTINQE